MPRKIIIDNCKCGKQKQIVSKTCRNCYVKTANKVKYITQACSCGNKKSSNKAKKCIICYKKLHIAKAANKTIAYYWKLYKGGPNAYTHIRVNARAFMERSNVIKQCYSCGYSKHVEVCHIKSISSFSKNTKLKVVNSEKNLIYLCRNHHWEFDNGMLKL